MKNIFSKISSYTKNISSFAKEKIDSISHSTKAKIWTILTAWFLWVSSQVQASDNWIKVETPWIGPKQFSEKYFGTSDWKLLKDRKGNFIVNPNTDFILGREYTIGRRENIEKKKSQNVEPIIQNEEKSQSKYEMGQYSINSNEFTSFSVEQLKSYFNFEIFLNSIIWAESSWRPNLVNDKTKAVWLWQALPETLVHLWYHQKWKLTTELLKKYKSNPKLQISYFYKYHEKALEYIASKPNILKKWLKAGKSIEIVIVESLAEANFAWPGSMWMWWKWGDWNMTIPEYKAKVLKWYLSQIAANDNQETISEIRPKVQKVSYMVPSTSMQDEWEKADTEIESELKTIKVEKIEVAKGQSANDSFYSENISDLRKVSDTVSHVVFDVDLKVDAVIGDISDLRIKKSIESKLIPYETKMEWLYANIYYYDNLAIQYEKEARSAIRIKRQNLLIDAKEARETAWKLRKVVAHFEGIYMKKAA